MKHFRTLDVKPMPYINNIGPTSRIAILDHGPMVARSVICLKTMCASRSDNGEQAPMMPRRPTAQNARVLDLTS